MCMIGMLMLLGVAGENSYVSCVASAGSCIGGSHFQSAVAGAAVGQYAGILRGERFAHALPSASCCRFCLDKQISLCSSLCGPVVSLLSCCLVSGRGDHRHNRVGASDLPHKADCTCRLSRLQRIAPPCSTAW